VKYRRKSGKNILGEGKNNFSHDITAVEISTNNGTTKRQELGSPNGNEMDERQQSSFVPEIKARLGWVYWMNGKYTRLEECRKAHLLVVHPAFFVHLCRCLCSFQPSFKHQGSQKNARPPQLPAQLMEDMNSVLCH
jgi:hypothetical protein